MKTIKQIERLREVHELIKLHKTGTPEFFANKLHISERQLYNCLEHLKEMDAPIQYDRKTHTYFYSESFDLLVNVTVQVMVQNELRDIYAGFVYLHEGFMEHQINLC
jgi:hypothetical protein